MILKNLFEKYGGFASINQIVMAFYDALLDSDELGPYFDNVDMKKLIDHQTQFISSVMGGPISFDERRLEVAHARLGVTSDHFDEIKVVLRETLEGFDVEEADILIILNEIEIRRSLVVR